MARQLTVIYIVYANTTTQHKIESARKVNTHYLRMRGEIAAVLSLRNQQNAACIIRREYAELYQNDASFALMVIEVRRRMKTTKGDLNKMEYALYAFQTEAGVSNTQMKRVCERAQILLKDGSWKANLRTCLQTVRCRVSRRRLNKYPLVAKFLLSRSFSRPRNK